MKLTNLAVTLEDDETPIATFGRAALIKNRQGRYVLKGGSNADRIEAREWISLFLHEVVVCN